MSKSRTGASVLVALSRTTLLARGGLIERVPARNLDAFGASIKVAMFDGPRAILAIGTIDRSGDRPDRLGSARLNGPLLRPLKTALHTPSHSR
jgi:hypothetical protein